MIEIYRNSNIKKNNDYWKNPYPFFCISIWSNSKSRIKTKSVNRWDDAEKWWDDVTTVSLNNTQDGSTFFLIFYFSNCDKLSK